MLEWKYTQEDLDKMQAWPLERKIQVTQHRLIEWKLRHKGKIYISFSGGKDSTVLADLTARIYRAEKLMNGTVEPLTLLFVNTGLEYPEIRQFTQEFAEWLRTAYEIPVDLVTAVPEMRFPEVLRQRGYPVLSKSASRRVRRLKHEDLTQELRDKLMAVPGDWKFLLDAPFECTEECCAIMKKGPADRFAEESGRVPIIGDMASESYIRRRLWFARGCNAFECKLPKSKPMSFWTEQDVLRYLKTTGIPYAPVYGEIVEAGPEEPSGVLTLTGMHRTGCMFCMFGINQEQEPNRFQQMKETHPRQYRYCIGGGHFEDGMLTPDEDGLGLGKVLDYLGIPY